jgi:ATP-dependent DNA helicase RecG
MSLTTKQKQILDIYQMKGICDFLSLYPHRYDYIEPTDESVMNVGDFVVLEGRIVTPIKSHFYAKNKSVSRFVFVSEHNEYSVSIFNRPWLKTPSADRLCTLIGKLDKAGIVLASNLYFKPVVEVTGIFPVYPLKKGITQKQVSAMMKKVFSMCTQAQYVAFPSSTLQEKDLLSLLKAQELIHFPKDKPTLHQAISTIKYVEFSNYHLGVLISVEVMKKKHKQPKKADALIIQNFINGLPFELTTDQVESTQQIIEDMQSDKIMMRLLQGDVGSGKTIVALIGALYAIYAGYQVALLAPTEILASQHFYSVKTMLNDPLIKVGFLSSSNSAPNRRKILEQVENEKINFIIGTHALFQESVTFGNLGLVITDEQHRFGVMQRQAMMDKGESVDVLSMSATPIPRTLANALFSELEVSTIKSMPKNRRPITTHLIEENSLRSIMDDLMDEISSKHQVYVVCPSIDQTTQSTRNVVTVYENIKAAYGNQFTLAMLHGQMDSTQKETIMESFKTGEIDMLICTTIIEVGIDVANATRLVVYDADRFGLSQLHQLRGRIGRSTLESVCYLLTSTSEEETLARLQVLVDYQSGFEIAYQDLVNRGPGEIVGIRQSGLPSFSFGNIVDDQDMLLQAKVDAQRMLEYPINEEERNYVNHVKKQKMESNAAID